MSSNDFGFDTNNVAPRASFDPMKPGWYAMFVASAEMVDGKSEATGRMCKLQLEVMADKHPDYANRKVFVYLCVQHQNQQTREIAQGHVASILEAIGKKGATSCDAMLGGELMVKLAIREAKGGYDASNEAKGFKPLGADTATTTGGGVKPAGNGALPGATGTQQRKKGWG